MRPVRAKVISDYPHNADDSAFADEIMNEGQVHAEIAEMQSLLAFLLLNNGASGLC